jgi:tRNA(adenine34) deaminase
MLIGNMAMWEARRDEFMGVALGEAALAAEGGDVPVGALLVDADGREIGRGRNRRELLGDPTAHAEMEALRAAFQRPGWRREGTTLFVTLEPCAMCMGALVLARVQRLVFGTPDPKAGAAVSLFRMAEDPRLNHRFEVVQGVRQEECAAQLRSFFAALRARRKDPDAER